jgi:hypothetical protein
MQYMFLSLGIKIYSVDHGEATTVQDQHNNKLSPHHFTYVMQE